MGEEGFFNSLADTWDELNRYPMDKIEVILNILNIKSGDTVLDVGTGTGVLLPLLIKRTEAQNITAIDYAEKMIEKAKNKLAGMAALPAAGPAAVHFITADVLEYHFTNGSFNHVICYSVFPHFGDKRAVIQKLSAALKPGGLLSVLHSSSRTQVNGTHTHIHSHGINSDYLLPAREYIPLMNRNGLKEEHITDNDEMFVLCVRKEELGVS